MKEPTLSGLLFNLAAAVILVGCEYIEQEWRR